MGWDDTGKPAQFFNVSEGHFVSKRKDTSTGEETVEKHYNFTGFVEGIIRKDDTYQGRPQKKIVVSMVDGDHRVKITFQEASWFGQTFFQRIHKVDFSQKLTLGINASKVNPKISFCWMKQGSEVVKKDPAFPEPPKTGEGQSDWSKLKAKIPGSLNYVQGLIQEAVASQGVQPHESFVEAEPEIGSADKDLPF